MKKIEIPDVIGNFEIVDGITIFYENGKVYCVQIDKDIDMKNTLIGELGGSVYIKEE